MSVKEQYEQYSKLNTDASFPLEKGKLPAAFAPQKIIIGGVVLAVVFASGYGVAYYSIFKRLPTINGVGVMGAAADTSAANITSYKDLSVTDFSFLVEIYSKIAGNYLAPKLPDKNTMVEAAAKGLVAGLGDKYTNYYTKSEWAEIQKSNAGVFAGVGIKLQLNDTYVEVETPLVSSPAQQAGIMAGDIILKVDDKSVEGKSVAQVAELIRGEENSKVKLGLYRPETQKNLDFELTRKKIDVKSIEYKKVGDNGMQISISKFTEDSLVEFQRQWTEAVNAAKTDKVNYVVLDLRNNTGGWVSGAQFIMEDFVPAGTVIAKEVDSKGVSTELKASRSGALLDIPLVVLVNGGSASASEIVAGALQDLGRAKVVGEPTIGKGVEQVIEQTSDGGVIFVVHKRWYTPNGKNLSSESPLKPDETVDITTEDIKTKRDPQLDKAIQVVLKK